MKWEIEGSKQSFSPLNGLCLHGFEKKLKCAADPFAQIVGPGKINGPPANNRGVDAFHEFRKVGDGKGLCDFAALLAFLQDFP